MTFLSAFDHIECLCDIRTDPVHVRLNWTVHIWRENPSVVDQISTRKSCSWGLCRYLMLNERPCRYGSYLFLLHTFCVLFYAVLTVYYNIFLSRVYSNKWFDFLFFLLSKSANHDNLVLIWLKLLFHIFSLWSTLRWMCIEFHEPSIQCPSCEILFWEVFLYM